MGCNGDPTKSCNDGGGCAGWTPTHVSAIQIVRYEVRVDEEGIPNLWRSPTGGLAATAGGPCAPAAGAGVSDWQAIARGIEDLQVEYMNDTGLWSDTPGVVVANDYSTIVKNVRITVSGRALAPMLAGETASAQGSAIRHQLGMEVTPRAALYWLHQRVLWR